MGEEKKMGQVISIDEKLIKDHLGELVRGTVEDTLNGMLDEEADRLCGAGKHERSPDRQDYRSGHYQRNLTTKAGDVKLNVPKLRRLPFETAIIERYKRRESSVGGGADRDVPGGCVCAAGGGHHGGAVGGQG